MKYVIPGCPIPWKAPYVGTRGTFSPRHGIMVEYKALLEKQHKGPLIDSAIDVSFIFYMPIPKATSKKKRALMISGELRPITTPDRCNCCKLYEDCLQGVVITNDSKIVDGLVGKYYSEDPRTEITIRILSECKGHWEWVC